MFEPIELSFSEGDQVFLKPEVKNRELVAGLLGKILVVGKIYPSPFTGKWFTIKDGLSESDKDLKGTDLPGGGANTVFPEGWFTKQLNQIERVTI